MSDLKIVDGTGTSRQAKVDTLNRLRVLSVIETEQLQESEEGNGYNLNTGTLALTDASVSAVLYMKNNEDDDFIITAIAVGIGVLTSPTDSTVITLVRQPTGGTIVDDATNVDMNANRNFSSAKTLTADVFKGGQGKTLTGGSDIAQFFASSGSRLFATIDFILPKGTTCGLTIDVNAAAGGSVYAAFIGYVHKET